MQPRTRTRTSYKSSGARYIGNPPNKRDWLFVDGPFPYMDLQWQCDDFIKKTKSKLTGRTPPSPLRLRKTSFKPVFLEYRHVSAIDGKLENRYSNVPCNVPGSAETLPPGDWSSIEGDTAGLTAKLLADTNPFRYEVSVPIMISEFLEAGSLLRLASNNFISLIGSQHLNYVFGWKPLMQDIRTLASITKAVESRIRDFNALLEKGGITRRKHLASGGKSNSESEVSIYSTGLGEWKGMAQTSWRSKVWGTVRWVPDRLEPVDIKLLTEFNQALLVALDLTEPDLPTIWEATPWTWLIDYFVNVGDVLQAIESSDLVIPTEVCLMRKRTVTTTTSFKRGPPSAGAHSKTSSGSSGECKHEYSLRELPPYTGVGDLLSFGFMSKSQATNLLGLLMSLTRFKK